MNIKPGSYIEFSLPEGTIKIPVDQEMRMLVNQRGRFSPKSLNMASFRGMFEYMDGLSRGGESDSLYKDFTESILFLGLTGTGTSDLGVTPFESSCPMVGYLATSAANIIEKDFLREVPDYLNILLILLFGFLASGITGGRPAHHAALLNILVLLILTISSLAAFKANIVFSLFYPAAAVAISYGGVTAYRFTMEEKEKKAIRGMFSRYVSSQIVDELMKNPETVKLGGSRKRLTVFFSDIRGFSSMAENLDPEEVVQILNEYLTEMIEIIFKHRGTLDKFMGDAIMAIWGAPVDEEEHAKLAVRAAWEMMNKLMELQKKWVQEGKKPISVGMGINTGEMVIGNMGSVQFSDYTVIGDNVNLAARLEQNAAAGQLIISKATYEEVKDIVEVRQLEPLMVKGKEKPQEVYEVVNVFA